MNAPASPAATTPAPSGASPADVLLALQQARFSCRGFLPDLVPRAVIERILASAQLTASWCNAQPWQVHIASGAGAQRFREGLQARLQGEPGTPDFPHPARYEGDYQARRRECGFQLYEAVGVARGDREASRVQALRNFELFGAPHVALITSEADLGIYGAVDCGAYVANFMLAAQSLGVATVAQAALGNHPDFVRTFFALPDTRRVVCGISFGYPDAAHPANGFRTRRAELSDVVQWVEN